MPSFGQLLERYESRLTIERYETDRLRLVSSVDDPVALMVDGYMVRIADDLYLAAADKPAGAAATYYIFANRADDSTAFTLSVSTSPTELTNQSRIGRFYWDGAKIVKDSVRTEFAVLTADRLYHGRPYLLRGTVDAGHRCTSPDR